MRETILTKLRRDLIGPNSTSEDADLAEEILPEEPSKWYLTGWIAPTQDGTSPLDEDDVDVPHEESLAGLEAPSTAPDDEGSAQDHTARKRFLPTSLGLNALPRLRGAASPAPAPILTGHRHVELVKEAMRMVELVESAGELQDNLAGIRDDWCADQATMPDSELRDIAGWAWTCRLENRIYRGRDSAFPMQRLALNALRGQANGADAIALLVLLVDQHRHSPGKRFPLDFDAMRAAGLLNLSKPRLRAARRTLEGAGLLRLMGFHRAGSNPQTFALTTAASQRAQCAANVHPMPSTKRGSGPGKTEGRG